MDIADQPCCAGCILVYFLEKGKAIDATCYVQTLNELRWELRVRRPKKKLSFFKTTTRGLITFLYVYLRFLEE
jgi:hypothetical protein